MYRIFAGVCILLVAAAMVASCSQEEVLEGEITGIVTEVTGDLVHVESFVVLDTQGESHKFVPGDGMTVMGAPPSHLRDHVVSGEAILVTFHTDPSGVRIAANVVHAGAEPGDHHEN